MTRVSEGSSAASLKYSLNKAKAKMEDLQLKGATLKSMRRPSDNPVSNVEVMQLKSDDNDNSQFLRNADFALMQLNVTEKSLEQITDILVKAKELAIAQSSDLYNPEVRKNVANEVIQMKNMMLGLANKRLGQRYIFGGFKTLDPPFNADGNYKGDKGHITLEVSKDFFVQTNLNGSEVFYIDEGFNNESSNPLKEFPEMKRHQEVTSPKENSRELASMKAPERAAGPRENIFTLLETLATALENNEPDVIQNLLEKFDTATSRLITLRTRVGSITSSVQSSKNSIDSDRIDNAERRSKLVGFLEVPNNV